MNTALLVTPALARQNGTEPRPLMPMAAVMWRLDLDESSVQVLIGNGALRWAFNIARQGAQRRVIRVLTESVEDLVFSRKRPCGPAKSEWPRVAGLIFPDNPSLGTGELARSLNCARQTVLNLIHGRNFKVVPGTHMRRGPNGSAQIVTASARDWLLKRRVL